jgi:predicted 2-oxoglutarate/Fe(II)-dependent dioxygenase YbiX
MSHGTIIAFPPILEHRVIPVTSGVRYSATMWFNGPRFR